MSGATDLGDGRVVLILDPAAVAARRASARCRGGDRGRRRAACSDDHAGSARRRPTPSSSSRSRARRTRCAAATCSTSTWSSRSLACRTPPRFVDGVVFSRGHVVPAVNLRARFGFERVPYNLRTRLLVVHADGRSVGLVVDEGREFIRIADAAIQPPQEAIAGTSGEYIEGIASLNGRLVLVVDLSRLLSFSTPLIPA